MPRGRRAGAAAYLSSIRQRVSTLNQERETLINELQGMLAELTGGAAPTGPRRRGRPPGSAAKGAKRGRKAGRRKGFKMSKAAREKIAAAQRKRWAEQKAKKA
jgi:hypothetical protein